jgi:hypothetical protein
MRINEVVMGIVDKAKNALTQNRLVGNSIFDDTEYDELLDITRNTSKDFFYRYSYLVMRREMEIVFITLIEITKRWKKLVMMKMMKKDFGTM